MQRVILDCDGVLLDWRTAFNNWLVDHQFVPNHDSWARTDYGPSVDQAISVRKLIEIFNETVYAGRLKPINKAVKAIDRLYHSGFELNVVTAFGDSPVCVKLRTDNLNNVFGDIFNKIICLPLGSPKNHVLEQFKSDSTWYIEDVESYVHAAVEHSIFPAENCAIVAQPWNSIDYPHKYFRHQWDYIVDRILN